MKKKVLFIGHEYHKKTKSSCFIQELLSQKYDLETFYYFPGKEEKVLFKSLEGKRYDILILWQLMPDLDMLKRTFIFEKCVFFPMYDGAISVKDQKWKSYQDVIIINFCKNLHKSLIDMGLTSYYIQYFPKPIGKKNYGDTNSLFLWQRTNLISIKTIEKLFSFNFLKHIHIHKAPDPFYKFIRPGRKIRKKVSYSNWFSTKEEMYKKIEESSLYMAPRVSEGIGMSFLEAMALGRCVIAPNAPTMNEYIENGKTGILYDLNALKTIDIAEENIRKIQENTYNYIEKGYNNWEQNKLNILEWMEQSAHPNLMKLNQWQFQQPKKILKVDLFNFIPFIRIKISREKIKINLWKIPLFIVKVKK